MLTTDIINNLLGIKESYQASDVLMEILFDKGRREELFVNFLTYEKNLSRDWFHVYFEEEHANKKKFAQDFTPDSISSLVSKIVKQPERNNGMSLDVAAGTGSLTIQRWQEDKLQRHPFDYWPSNYFYQCEELSDRALPFLLFNLMIRGMNGVVIHGDSLTRDVKQIYFIQNFENDHMKFSDLNVIPHNEMVKKAFGIKEWTEKEVAHIERVHKIR